MLDWHMDPSRPVRNMGAGSNRCGKPDSGVRVTTACGGGQAGFGLRVYRV